jgi:hypothetical protein
MHHGSRVLWGCSALPVILPWSPQLCQNGGLSVVSSIVETKKYGGWWMTVMLFLVKSSLVKNEMWDGALSCCNSQFLFAKVQGKDLAHFHTGAVKHHSSMWNQLFGQPGWICEQSFWCQRKWQECSWLCSSPVSHFLVSMSLDFLCMAYAFFQERLSSHCQGLCCICSQIYTKFDAVTCQIHYKISISTHLREIVHTDSQDMPALSSTVASC